MKRLFILMFMFFLVAFTGCTDSKEESADDEDFTDSDMDAAAENEAEPDMDSGIDEDVIEQDDSHGDPLDDPWMTPEDSWTSWVYLKIMGEIGTFESEEYVPAVFTDGKIKLSELGKTYELIDGWVYSDEKNMIAEAQNYEFKDVNETLKTGKIDLKKVEYRMDRELIKSKAGSCEQGIFDFGAHLLFSHIIADFTFNDSGKKTSLIYRQICHYGVSETEERTVDNEAVFFPVGGINGCFESNVDGSVGEEIKIMFKNEVSENPSEILTFVNTLPNGTVLEPEDEGYTKQCTCYEPDGVTEVSCDGEETPDETPEGEEPDETLDDTTDETTDNDVEQ